MGGAGYDVGTAITTDLAGNIYTTGRFTLTADFDPSSATFYLNSTAVMDVFISKLDASGKFVWAKQLASKNDNNMPNAIKTDASSNIYTVGSFNDEMDLDPSAD